VAAGKSRHPRRCAYKAAKHDGPKQKLSHLASGRHAVNLSSIVLLMRKHIVIANGVNGLLPFLKNYHKKVNLKEILWEKSRYRRFLLDT
jgi:hypothetical protein